MAGAAPIPHRAKGPNYELSTAGIHGYSMLLRDVHQCDAAKIGRSQLRRGTAALPNIFILNRLRS
jgi:hypothetical protein